jgi:hypothetical protein
VHCPPGGPPQPPAMYYPRVYRHPNLHWYRHFGGWPGYWKDGVGGGYSPYRSWGLNIHVGFGGN